MKRVLILAVAAAMLTAWGWTNRAQAAFARCMNCTATYQSQMSPWHGGYYDVAWGMPVAVLVPPTAENQTHWGWGVGATRVTPIYHQFHRGWPGPGVYERSWFRPTPHWPSSTDQFGDYYVRGPW